MKNYQPLWEKLKEWVTTWKENVTGSKGEMPTRGYDLVEILRKMSELESDSKEYCEWEFERWLPYQESREVIVKAGCGVRAKMQNALAENCKYCFECGSPVKVKEA